MILPRSSQSFKSQPQIEFAPDLIHGATYQLGGIEYQLLRDARTGTPGLMFWEESRAKWRIKYILAGSMLFEVKPGTDYLKRSHFKVTDLELVSDMDPEVWSEAVAIVNARFASAGKDAGSQEVV